MKIKEIFNKAMNHIMKKNLFLINSLEAGGAERELCGFANILKESTKVYLSILKIAIFYKLPDVPIIPLSKARTNFSFLLNFPIAAMNFRRVLKIIRPEYVFSSLELSNFFNLLFNPYKKIVSVEISLDFFRKRGLKNFFYLILIKMLYPRVDLFKVNSKQLKYEIVKEFHVNPSRVYVLYNPIDLEQIELLKKEPLNQLLLNRISGKKVFITMGRLVKIKRFEKLIKGFGEIAKKDANCVLLILGGGPMKKTLKQILLEPFKSRIIFLGIRKNVFKYLNNANFFLYS
ncbi:MAG: glycosyltransferase, partial [Candidatus Sigynarchaeota archaeon]